MSVDIKHGFIRSIATSTASKHYGHHFEEVLDEHNTGRDVCADKAYPSRRRQEMLKVLGWRDGMQRRAGKDKPLSECQKWRNRKIASKRAKVEHVFAGIRHLGRQVHPHHRAGAGGRGDDADGGLPQHQAAGEVHVQGVDPFYKHTPA